MQYEICSYFTLIALLTPLTLSVFFTILDLVKSYGIVIFFFLNNPSWSKLLWMVKWINSVSENKLHWLSYLSMREVLCYLLFVYPNICIIIFKTHSKKRNFKNKVFSDYFCNCRCYTTSYLRYHWTNLILSICYMLQVIAMCWSQILFWSSSSVRLNVPEWYFTYLHIKHQMESVGIFSS